MANIKESMPKKEKKNHGSKIMGALPYILLGIILSLMALHYFGIIDLSKYRPKFMDSNSESKGIPSGKCPKTSCDTGVCCHSSEYDPSIETNVAVYAVITYDKCECPSDTTYEGNRDTITPGGPYKICICNEMGENT